MRLSITELEVVHGSKKTLVHASVIGAVLILIVNLAPAAHAFSILKVRQSSPTLTTKLSKQDYDSRKKQKLHNGVVPNVLGLNSLFASHLLSKASFSPSWTPSDFDQNYPVKSQFETNGANWYVCRQGDIPGNTVNNPGYEQVGVSRDCTGYGVAINVVGMKALIGWKLLVNRGFSPQYESSDIWDSANTNLMICSQDHSAGTTSTDEYIALDLFSNCAKSPNNPNSRDGTRIFINDSNQEITELEDDVGKAATWLAGGHKILITGSIIGITLQSSFLKEKVAPSRYRATWKFADDALQSAEANLNTAVQNWMSGSMNQGEVSPFLSKLLAAAENLKRILRTIPYPK